MQSVVEKAKKLKLLILDVDGVLTDGKLFFDNDGNEYKSFHAQRRSRYQDVAADRRRGRGDFRAQIETRLHCG